mgnify:CR=1 FL=1
MTTPSAPDRMRPKILIADDHAPNRVALRRILDQVDVDIVEAASGNDALWAALDHEFALILLDVRMPDMDGFEAATLLSGEERTRGTPIIFLTASYVDDVNRLRGYRFGAADYIIKPVDEIVLLSKVRIFLELYRSKLTLRAALAELSRRNQELEFEISQRQLAEERERHLAHHDPLTGLANRALFLQHLDEAIGTGGETLALLYLDVDVFKTINDTHGHEVGNDLLTAIAGRMRECMEDAEMAARLGGDEFAALLRVADAGDASRRVGSIVRAVLRPYEIRSPDERSLQVRIGGSFGVALYPYHGRECRALLHAADGAMYKAKRERQALHMLPI